MERVDALVIRAGMVGLAEARTLAQRGHEVLLVDVSDGVAQGVSSSEIEVVHAGLYYAPGSLKARMHVRVKELHYALAQSHGVPHRRCGKLGLATELAQHATLEQLAAVATAATTDWSPFAATGAALARRAGPGAWRSPPGNWWTTSSLMCGCAGTRRGNRANR